MNANDSRQCQATDAATVETLRDYFHGRLDSEQAMSRLQPQVQKWAAAHARRWHDASFRKDMVDKALGNLFQSLGRQQAKGEEPTDWIAWCRRCIMNKMMTAARRRSQSKNSLPGTLPEPARQGPIAAIEQAEALDKLGPAVWAATDKLKPQDRLLCWLDHWDEVPARPRKAMLKAAGLDETQLAELLLEPKPGKAYGKLLGISLAAQRQRVSRARQQLRKALCNPASKSEA